MEVIFILAGLALAVNKTVTVLKAALTAPRDLNMALTQTLVWLVGLVAVILASNAAVTETIVLPGITIPFGELDWASQFLLGWILGGTGSFAYDLTHPNKPEPPLVPSLDPSHPSSQ